MTIDDVTKHKLVEKLFSQGPSFVILIAITIIAYQFGGKLIDIYAINLERDRELLKELVASNKEIGFQLEQLNKLIEHYEISRNIKNVPSLDDTDKLNEHLNCLALNAQEGKF